MIKFLIFLVLFVKSYCLFGQNRVELFFVRDLDIQGQDAFIKANNIKTFQIIYENFFVTNQKVDEVKLKKQLSDKFPNVNDEGICVLDWEGQGIKAFQNQNDIKKFNYYKSEFKRAIQIAKTFRPKVKFGFFHLLYLDYYGRISDFRKQNSNLDDLISLQDFLAPALYVYNPKDKYQKSNDNYMRNKLLQALEVGDKYNIPVYPFIWHRTVSRIKNAGNELIPTSYFANAVKLISQTSFRGRMAKGVLWWHSESYSYRNRTRFSIARSEYRSINDINVYQKNLFQKYFNSIKQFVY